MSLLRLCSRNYIINNFKYFSSKTAIGGQSTVESVVLSDDGRTFVAWHPEPEFPYEFSKPIPTATEINNKSLLKEKVLSSAMEAFKSKHPEIARQELMSVTYTTKHRWFPRARDKKAKTTKMDRPYL